MPALSVSSGLESFLTSHPESTLTGNHSGIPLGHTYKLLTNRLNDTVPGQAANLLSILGVLQLMSSIHFIHHGLRKAVH